MSGRIEILRKIIRGEKTDTYFILSNNLAARIVLFNPRTRKITFNVQEPLLVYDFDYLGRSRYRRDGKPVTGKMFVIE